MAIKTKAKRIREEEELEETVVNMDDTDTGTKPVSDNSELPKTVMEASMISRIYWSVKSFFSIIPLEKIGYTVLETETFSCNPTPVGVAPTLNKMIGSNKYTAIDRTAIMRCINHIITSCQVECKGEMMIEVDTDHSNGVIMVTQGNVLLIIDCGHLVVTAEDIDK